MISVIIPTFQRPVLLQSALRSVVRQAWRDVEVFVINDGGLSVEAAVDPWRSQLPLTLIELPQNCGPARARNVGIERASGQYIAFLDDDDLFLPEHLETAEAMLASDRTLDFVYLGALVSDRRLTAMPPDWSRMDVKAYEFDERFLLVANYIHTGSVVVRNFSRSRIRFDESLSRCEDWDLWLALRLELGYRIKFIDRLTTIYHLVADTPGLVGQGQITSPTPFALVRDRLNSKWPTDDEYVLEYRDWLTQFESCRNQVIAEGRPVPMHLFDRVLAYLNSQFKKGDHANASAIPALFDRVASAV